MGTEWNGLCMVSPSCSWCVGYVLCMIEGGLGSEVWDIRSIRTSGDVDSCRYMSVCRKREGTLDSTLIVEQS